MPEITYINDERDGDLSDLEYQGTTYRKEIVSNRDLAFEFEETLKAIQHLNGGPEPANLLERNDPFWVKNFNSSPPLSAKGQSTSFDIDGLAEALEATMAANRAEFLSKPRSVAFVGQWADREEPDVYLVPISITTVRDSEIIIGECLSCNTRASWTLPPVPKYQIPSGQGEVRIEIPQRVGLEREAFDVRLAMTPYVERLDDVSISLHINDEDGADARSLFYEIVTEQNGILNLSGSPVLGPLAVGWQLIPSSDAGGTQTGGRNYLLGAAIHFRFEGSSFHYSTPPETITVLRCRSSNSPTKRPTSSWPASWPRFGCVSPIAAQERRTS